MAEILERLDDHDEGARRGVSRAIAEVASETFLDPRGRKVQLSERTLWRWLAAYVAQGFAGLRPKIRKDLGVTRAIAAEILARAEQLRRERPGRATPTIIDILERTKKIEKDAVARSTLDRHFDRLGLSRRHLRVRGEKPRRQIQTERPLQLVVTDFHHGPYVRVDAEGTLRRALLCAFIDHFSRYVLEGRYYLHEDVAALRCSFRACVTVHGLMERLYADNGPSYQSNRFEGGVSQLGSELVHSKAYDAESRGVIERFNGTLKDQFEAEVRARDEPPTLTELNAFWEAWLQERYHRTEHSVTGEAPLDRFQRHYVPRPAPDLARVDELLRLRERRTVNRKWSTVEVDRVYYLVDSALRGRRVDVLHDPLEPSYVLVVFDGKVVQRAYQRKPGDVPQAEPPPPALAGPKTDYLAILRADHERRQQAELGTLRLKKPTAEPELSLVDLLALVERCRAKALDPPEHSAVGAFWRKWRPLDSAQAAAALEAAARRLGPALHVSVYLEALGERLLRLRTKGGRPS